MWHTPIGDRFRTGLRGGILPLLTTVGLAALGGQLIEINQATAQTTPPAPGEAGAPCKVGGDCNSGICKDSVCHAPAVGDTCERDSDCGQYICDDSTCVDPCTDLPSWGADPADHAGCSQWAGISGSTTTEVRRSIRDEGARKRLIVRIWTRYRGLVLERCRHLLDPQGTMTVDELREMVLGNKRKGIDPSTKKVLEVLVADPGTVGDVIALSRGGSGGGGGLSRRAVEALIEKHSGDAPHARPAPLPPPDDSGPVN